MSLQTVIEQVSRHLATQKVQAIQGTVCVYKTTVKGVINMCAVGVLITDELHGDHLVGMEAADIFAAHEALQDTEDMGDEEIAFLEKVDVVAKYLSGLLDDVPSDLHEYIYTLIQRFHDADENEQLFLHMVNNEGLSDEDLYQAIYTNLKTRTDSIVANHKG
ncbi:hypothetical protein D3C87_1428130 [compost metagenome]